MVKGLDLVQRKRAILTSIGGGIAFIALYLPIMYVTYDPPGGYAILYGKRMNAFYDAFTGWQFATNATYTLLYPAVLGLLTVAVIDFIRLLLPASSTKHAINVVGHIMHSKITGGILDYVQAFVHVVIALLWLLILLISFLVGTETMPLSGEVGLVSSFRVTPQINPVQQPIAGPTPHLSSVLGIGYYLLVIGIGIGGMAIFKKAIITTIALIVLLILLAHFNGSYYQQVLHFLGL